VSVTRLILASGSQSRAAVLRHAGCVFEQLAADVDENIIKTQMKATGGSAAACAQALADQKALTVSKLHPTALVIGCDQMLACGDDWFDKPTSRDSARMQLLRLRGQQHALFNGMSAAVSGQIVWQHADNAYLRMRMFSEAFVESYLEDVGEDALKSVGGYQLEGRGAQLFETITGDFFSILGLPLLPLLALLRHHGLIRT
jgi:septum formation protein